MIYTDVLARFKDVVIILFFFSVLRISRWEMRADFFKKNAFGWFLIYVAASFPISVYSQFTPYGSAMHLPTSFGWALYLRAIYFCLLIYCLREYFLIYREDVRRIAKLYVISCMCFIAFNTVAYFYHFPFMTVFRPWPGRISAGYPTSDALMLLFAMMVYFFQFYRARARDFFILSVLLLGVLANATGSGIGCLGLLCGVYALLNVKTRPKQVLLYIAVALVLMSAIAVTGYFLLQAYAPKSLATMLLIINARGLEGLAIVSGQGAAVTPGATQGSGLIRFLQYAYRARYNETFFDDLFGLGAFFGYVENEFFHILLVWGLVGLAIFLATIAESFFSVLSENRIMLFYCLIIWLTACTVLITTYLFSLFVPFSIIMASACVQPIRASGWPLKASLNPSHDRM